jgi:hypothetical protein
MPQNPIPSTLFVSKIKAGSGVTVTPSGGTGIVTVAVGGTEAPTAIAGGANPFPITGQAAASVTAAGGEVDVAGAAGGATSGAGGPAKVTGGAGTGGNSAGGEADLTGGAGHGNSAGGASKVAGGVGGATGAGGAASLTGGAGGAGAGGNGGTAPIAGGAAGAGSNGNGGDVVLTGGALDGTGLAGNIVHRSIELRHQGTPAAKTVSATLTSTEVLNGIITVNQGATAASALQLPLATAMDTALPNSIANDAVDFSVINISTDAAEAASITTNTGWTLVGDMDIPSNSAATTKSAGRLRARKTGTGTWTLYRLS